MEEDCKELGFSSKTETLDGEDAIANTVEVSDYGVCDENPDDGGSATGDGSLEAGDGNMGNSVSDEKQVKDDVVGGDEVLVGSVTGEESDVVVETEDNVDKIVSSDDLERTDTLMEPETETAISEVKSENGASHEIAGEEDIVASAGNEMTNEKAKCEVEDNSDACGAEENFQTEKSQQSLVDNGTLSVAENKADLEKESTKKIEEDYNKLGVDSEDKKEEKVGLPYNEQGISVCETSDADQEKEAAMKSEEDNNKMDVDSKQTNEENVGLNEQGNPGYETTDVKHSESAQVPEEATQLSKGNTNEENLGDVSEVISAAEICHEEEITNVNQKEEIGEDMEIDYAAEGQVGKDVTVGDVLDNAGNESVGGSMVQIQDVPTAEAERNDSNVIEEMEIDEWKDNADMANLNSPIEDAAPAEVEPLDHNALFDPSSDITNFIDFSGVSSWSRNNNIQDHKTETESVSLKEDKKAIDLAEEVASVDCKETVRSVDAIVNAESHDNLSLSADGIQNDSSEACAAFGAESSAATIVGYDENHEDEDHEGLDKKTVDNQGAMREEYDNTHEALNNDPNQMEENPNNFDYTDDGTDCDIKTNGVKRKADVMSEDSPGEGTKIVSLAKVSFAERPSFKIGACIARAASQMAGSHSVLKGSYFGEETLSVESFLSQLLCAAADPVKETVISDIASGFFLDFRNSSATQQVIPETISNKRGRPSNSDAVGTEAFEFEEMGDTYWTDRVIHNGGEEQTPPTEKGNYQVVPVELKPTQVRRTRRPYRRRQSQIIIPHAASEKPAEFDEHAPAELIMNFSETDTIPPEKSLCKMFRHFGPIRESQTEVDRENNRARVVFKKGADAKVACNSAGRFNIFGTKAVNYELSDKITETFKVQPYVVSLGEEEAAPCLSS